MEIAKITMVDYKFGPSIYEAVKRVNKLLGGKLHFQFYDAREVDQGLVNHERFRGDLRDSHVVLLNIMGGDVVSKIVCEELSKTNNTVVVLVGGSSEIVSLTRLGSFSFKMLSRLGMGKRKADYSAILKMRERFERIGRNLPFSFLKHARNYVLLLKYYENPTVENYYAMLLLLIKEYCKLKIVAEIPEPQVLPSMGIMNFKSGNAQTDINDYLTAYEYKDRPLVGILFYGGHHHEESYPAARLLTEKLESSGFGVIPVFSGDLRYYLAIDRFFFIEGKPIVELIIDLLWFRFAGGPIGGDHTLTLNSLSRLNVPILHGVQLHSRTTDEWLCSRQGLSPIEIVTSVTLPELDGRIEPTVTHGPIRKTLEDVKVEEYQAIEERVEKLARRAKSWINLRNKRNSEKRIAIIIYNYPPGEENLGKAEGLEIFKSLSRLLQAMKERGYTIPETLTPEKIKEILLSKGIVNSGKWLHTSKVLDEMIKVPQGSYGKWLKELPEKPLSEVLSEWGNPPGTIMVRKNQLLIPGIMLGNVFIGVQPTRGVHENISKIYHDKDLPPHHQYIAFYKWIKNEFKADALIHLGTHGTLEFLPGKEVGLSNDCFPDILVDDLPNIYVYHVVNASEASIAKRRSYALIINHTSPPLTVSNLPDEFLEIDNLIKEYFDFLHDKVKSREISQKVMEKARKYGLGETVEEVYDRLSEYRRSLIPKGLHVLGEKMSSEEIIDYLTFLSRYDRSETKSMHRIILESRGIDYNMVLNNSYKGSKSCSAILQETDLTVKALLKTYLTDGKLDFDSNVNKAELEKCLTFLKGVYEKLMQSDEINSILNALEGKFIPPGPGGDPVRTPEIYPTGRNTYALDPTRVPTETAMERGKIIAESYLRQFYEKHGKYPKTVSVVLWAFETMKTGGETVAAIFHLLGVKPVLKGLYIRDLEVIPIEELKRPRIDVVVTICGIFRDTFYNVVEMLDKAFRLVAELNEPEEMNYIKSNVKKQAQHGEKAAFRIFGPPEGLYATGITSLIEASNWKSEAEIVNAYLESMKFAYGEKRRNVEAKDFLETLLSNVDLVAQIRDTTEYEITDLDHYYEFLGGLSRTVKEKKGCNPEVYVADTTKEIVKIEDVKESIKRGIVTRMINPKWLDAMIEHGFNGITKIADRVEYMLGLAATLNGVENWMWDKVAEKTILDKERNEKMKRANPWAFRKTVEKMLESIKRGYWKADDETIKKLEKEYLEIEKILEDSA